jgi:hypothetical protein
MIHEIVSSDVDFVRGMMDSGHPDAEILAYLASRSLEPAKAAQLVDDLRHGRKPSVQMPFEIRPDGHSAVEGRKTARTEPYQAPQSHQHSSRSGKHKRSSIPWWFIIIVGIALVALGYVLLETGSNLSTEGINKDKHEIPPPPGK